MKQGKAKSIQIEVRTTNSGPNQRYTALRFLLILGMLVTSLPLKPSKVYANTLTVMNTAASGAGSLAQLITDAVAGDTITFDPLLNGQTITLTSQLNIAKNLTIQGPGANQLKLKTGSSYYNNIFKIAAGTTVNISGLTIADAAIVGYPSVKGAGISNSGILTLESCVVANNKTGGASYDEASGGGIYNTGTLTINNSSIISNTSSLDTATGGGGIFNDSSSAILTLNNVTVSGNSSLHFGGGIYNNGGTVTINYSTITNNIAEFGGGGIYNESGGTVTVKSSVIAGNNYPSSPDCGGSITSGTYNLIGNTTGCTWASDSSDQTGAASLGTLATNGGSTPSHRPLATSPVLNKIPSGTNSCGTAPFDKDQRGKVRPADTLCDLGAFESQTLSSADSSITADEDTAYTFQTSDFPFNDADTAGSTLAGIQVVTLPTAGTLTCNGTAVAANADCADVTKLVFASATNASGSPYTTFTFKVKSSNATYSTNSYTMTVNVTAVNDPPTSADNSVTTSKDTPYTFLASDFPFTDVDVGDTFGGIQVVTLPTVGTLMCNGTAVAATTDCPDITKLTFTPVANDLGSPYTTFTFKVKDSSSGYSVSSYTMTINVTTANDPPTSADGLITATKDIAYTFQASDFSFTDVDVGDTFAGIKIVASPTGGTLACNGTAVAANTDCADLTKLTFTPFANASGSPYTTFTFKVKDSRGAYSTSSYTLTINVLATNDPPTSTDSSVTTSKNLAYTFQITNFTFIDPNSDAFAGIRIITLPTVGTLTCNGTAVAANTDCADLTKLTFTPVANASGSPYTTFTFKVKDSRGAYSASSYTLTINVTAVNNPPVITVNTGLALPQGQSTTISVAQINATDVEDNASALTYIIVQPPAHGTLLKGGVVLALNGTFNQADLTTNQLTYQHDGSSTTADSFTFKVRDSGNAESATSVFSLTISAAGRMQIFSFRKYTWEDRPLTFSPLDFTSHATDTTGLKLTNILIKSLPTSGTLLLASEAITIGQTILITKLNTLVYSPTANLNGQDKFLWNGGFGSTYALTAAQVTLTITPVNDLALLSNATVRGQLNTSLALTSTLFKQNFNDPDGTLTIVKIQSLPSNGTLQLNGVNVQRYQEISVKGLDGLKFVPNKDWLGTTSFTWNGSEGKLFALKEAVITLEFKTPNQKPTALLLSNSVLQTKQPVGTVLGTLGTLTAVDPDSGDTHTFALVEGMGSTDNSFFSIAGAKLTVKTQLNTAKNLSIRLQAKDSGGLTVEKAFSIVVSNDPIITVSGQVLHADDSKPAKQALIAINETKNGKIVSSGVSQNGKTDAEGNFSLSLPVNRTYQIGVQTLAAEDAADYFPPTPTSFTLKSTDKTKVLTALKVQRAVKQIVGTVVYSGTKTAVSATLVAVNKDSKVKRQATTDAKGQYKITVAGGAWSVSIDETLGKGDWIFTELPKTVEFQKTASEAETQTANLNVQKASYFIYGQTLSLDGTPLKFGDAQSLFGITLWNMNSQKMSLFSLEPNGSFKIPVTNKSAYRLKGWVHPFLNLLFLIFFGFFLDFPDIPAQKINGISANVGNVQLVVLNKWVSGRVTGRDGSGMADVPIIAWKDGKQFSAKTDKDGKYIIFVNEGTWSVSPDTGNPATDSFIYDGTATKITLTDKMLEAKADFVVSRAGAKVQGKVVDADGDSVEARLVINAMRPKGAKPAVVAPVEKGQFALRLPEDCENCTFRATYSQDTSYSLVDSPTNPLVVTNLDGTKDVTFAVQLDDGKVYGRFLDSATKKPISGLRGKVLLKNKTLAYTTLITSDGSYTFQSIANGDYTLTYELEREAGEVLAQKTYIPVPTAPLTVKLKNGAVVPVAGASLQAASNDVSVGKGKEVTVKVASSCKTLSAVDNTLPLYPVVMKCRYANGTVTKVPCVTQPDNTARCYTPIVNNPQPVCSTEFGDSPSNTVTGGTKSLAQLDTALATILADTSNRENERELVHQFLQGKAAGNPSLSSMAHLMRRPEGQAPPRQKKVDEATQRNGQPVAVEDRSNDTFVFGMLKGPDGAYISDETVQMNAFAAGNDGQVKKSSAKGGYYLFEIAASSNTWTVEATLERQGTQYQAKTTFNPAKVAENGVVMLPDLTLAAAGTSLPTASQSFSSTTGTQATLTTSSSATQSGQMLNATTTESAMTVDVPPGAIPEDLAANIRMMVDAINAPSTGFDQVIGPAYRIAFVNRETGMDILTTFDAPLNVALPYDQAQLTALGISIDQVQAATFSNDTNSWTPLAQFSLDSANSVVLANLDRPVDAIALIAPKPEEAKISSISNDGPAVIIPFLLQTKSVVTSTLEVPAGLTVQPGATSPTADVAPVAVAEARVIAPFQPTQPLVVQEGEAALGSFSVDLLDAQGNVILPGLLSKPITLTMAFEQALLPQGMQIRSTGADYFDQTLSEWQPTQFVTQKAMLNSTGSSMVIVNSNFNGEFTAIVSNRFQVFLPLIANSTE